jgi:hypothetical protein
LTPKISALLEQRNSAKRTTSMKAKAKTLGEVLLRFDSPEKVTQTMVSSVYSMVLACFFLVAGVGLLMIASVVGWFSGNIGPRIILMVPCIPIVWVVQVLFSLGIKWQNISDLARRRRQALDDFCVKGDRTKSEEFDFLKQWDEKHFGITYDAAKAVLTADKGSKIPSQKISDVLSKT